MAGRHGDRALGRRCPRVPASDAIARALGHRTHGCAPIRRVAVRDWPHHLRWRCTDGSSVPADVRALISSWCRAFAASKRTLDRQLLSGHGAWRACRGRAVDSDRARSVDECRLARYLGRRSQTRIPPLCECRPAQQFLHDCIPRPVCGGGAARAAPNRHAGPCRRRDLAALRHGDERLTHRVVADCAVDGLLLGLCKARQACRPAAFGVRACRTFRVPDAAVAMVERMDRFRRRPQRAGTTSARHAPRAVAGHDRCNRPQALVGLGLATDRRSTTGGCCGPSAGRRTDRAQPQHRARSVFVGRRAGWRVVPAAGHRCTLAYVCCSA